jgi:hypothetical protein
MYRQRASEIIIEFPCGYYGHIGGGLVTKEPRVFKLTQMQDCWYWRLEINRDDGLIGPFETKEEAIKDACETLGLKEGE